MRAARPIGTGGNVRQAGLFARMVGADHSKPVASPKVSSKPTCVALKADGTRCSATPMKATGVCIGHRRQEEAAKSANEG